MHWNGQLRRPTPIGELLEGGRFDGSDYSASESGLDFYPGCWDKDFRYPSCTVRQVKICEPKGEQNFHNPKEKYIKKDVLFSFWKI